MENNNPTCPFCNKETEYFENGTMESYWGTFFVNYKDVPMYVCKEECEKIYSLRVVNIAQSITKVLSELDSSIQSVSLKNILKFIGDDVLNQEIFIERLEKQEISFVKDSRDVFYVDDIQLIKLNRYKTDVNFNDQVQIAARDGKISDKDAEKIIKLLSEEEDDTND